MPRSGPSGAGGDAESLLVDGWGDPEPWGRAIPADDAKLAIPLTAPAARTLLVRLRLRSTGPAAATVEVTEQDGTVHLLTADPSGEADQTIAVDPPDGTTLELDLASVGGAGAGVDEVTVLIG